MFIPRVLTLFVAGVLAAATLDAQNVIRDGRFQPNAFTHWAPSAIPDQYLVVFEPAATRDDKAAAEEAVTRLGGTVVRRYGADIQGLRIQVPRKTSVQGLRALPGVASLARANGAC
jgi:hypothetical protein